MARRRFVDVTQIGRLYYAGLTITQVADATGYKPNSIRRALTRRGYPMRDDRYAGGTRIPPATQELIRGLRAEGRSYRAIAALAGISYSGVRAFLVRDAGSRQTARRTVEEHPAMRRALGFDPNAEAGRCR